MIRASRLCLPGSFGNYQKIANATQQPTTNHTEEREHQHNNQQKAKATAMTQFKEPEYHR
jgi:hypothetical protein